MIVPGEIISYNEMCLEEGFNIQRGMNFKVNAKISVILMSLRKNAPYADRIEDEGKTLIYEGHDAPRNLADFPKRVDQPKCLPSGSLTQNGKFEESVNEFKKGTKEAEKVKVYEKIKPGIWSYNSLFKYPIV